MGCEFSDKVRAYQQELVIELFDQLNMHDKKKFKIQYGPPAKIDVNEAYRAYYHCKRILRTYPQKPEEKAG